MQTQAQREQAIADISTAIYQYAADRIVSYCSSAYPDGDEASARAQLEDYIAIVSESAAYMLGNALALVGEKTQLRETQRFSEKLHAVIEKTGNELTNE